MELKIQVNFQTCELSVEVSGSGSVLCSCSYCMLLLMVLFGKEKLILT